MCDNVTVILKQKLLRMGSLSNFAITSVLRDQLCQVELRNRYRREAIVWREDTKRRYFFRQE